MKKTLQQKNIAELKRILVSGKDHPHCLVCKTTKNLYEKGRGKNKYHLCLSHLDH